MTDTTKANDARTPDSEQTRRSSHCSAALTPQQMKSMKRDAETQIREIIHELSNRTGLIVDGINFRMTDLSTTEGTHIECTAVELDVRLAPY